jgi:hypothetical protein
MCIVFPSYDFDGKFFDGTFGSVYNEKDRQLLITVYEQSAIHENNQQETEHFNVEESSIVKPVGIAQFLNDLYFYCSYGKDSVVKFLTHVEGDLNVVL